MIFGKLILGGFGILMSNMSQVQNILLFQGCDIIVLRLHTAGTESPDNPKHIRVPPISMNVTQTPPDAHQTSPRHPQDISREQEMPPDDNRQQQTQNRQPQTPPRHHQGARDANRQQQTPTDTAVCTQTAHVSVLGCLKLSLCVCWRLLLSVGALCSQEISWGCMGGVVGGYLGVSKW